MTSDRRRRFTEIPEPDYDDDSDDDVIDHPAAGFYDNEPDDVSLSERVDDDDEGTGQVADVDEDDDQVLDESYNFDGVRAKLEAFSLEQQQLRGSVLADDDNQGCHQVY